MPKRALSRTVIDRWGSMPVPTETFRSIKKLNAIFAISALALLGSVGWMVLDDYNRQFRQWQRDGRQWQIAMTLDRQNRTSDDRTKQRIHLLERRMAQFEIELVRTDMDEQIRDLKEKILKHTGSHAKLDLPTATVKGQIAPLEQQIEKARLARPQNHALIDRLTKQLNEVVEVYRKNNEKMVELARLIEQTKGQLDKILEEQTKRRNQLKALTRQRDSLREKLSVLDPEGLWANLGDTVRDRVPLLDWMNPSEKPMQVVIPEVKTNLHTHLIETIDRCHSCHINIDNPAFSQSNVILYAQRQIAQEQGQEVWSVDQPVVMLHFWVDAVQAAGPALSKRLDNAVTQAIDALGELDVTVDQPALSDVEGLEPDQRLVLLMNHFDNIAKRKDATNERSRLQQRYRLFIHFVADLKSILASHLGDEQFALLTELYRHELMAKLNELRRDKGLSELNPSSAMLAHSRLDLYVSSDSKHPMEASGDPTRTMGCTVCHEGSGQETVFEHTAHTPQDIWVDVATGASVPQFLIRRVGTRAELIGPQRSPAQPALGRGAAIGQVSTQERAVDHTTSQSNDHALDRHATIYDGINLNKRTDPAPFGPRKHPHGNVALYVDLGTNHAAGLRPAVLQADFWKQKYGWAHVHYGHWEKPMHKLDYVESSCNKCHTEVFDLKTAAPRLYEGRLLFAQLGCVNCHAVTDLEDDLDIRMVGPSLVHLKHKLSPSMIASWIWSPKAFRPTTKMPHYFMLENNSSPVDILRTRVEVAAITHYLLHAKSTPEKKIDDLADKQEKLRPQQSENLTAIQQAEIEIALNAIPAQLEKFQEQVPRYAPMTPSVELGNAERGRLRFHQIGCLACHTNLNEHGQQWIEQDLVEREGISTAQALARYDQMTYNQRNWYVLEHLEDKLQRTGPELSAIGTKLLAGRSREQARAWLYDWLMNPRNYHSYTIMPELRLTSEEASDITAYLLDQTRDDYEPDDFALDRPGRQMLEHLVIKLLAAQSTTAIAHQEFRDNPQQWSKANQLMFLGRKTITHYGCNGCHQINGFEKAVSACTTLDDWGRKNPHMLDFGHYEHAFDDLRDQPRKVWKVKRHGLTADAPQIKHYSKQNITETEVAWEHIENERRPWFYHKLHNSRVYDRGRTRLDGGARIASDGQVMLTDSYRPYDKLKMPRFYLTDRQARALLTFVTSIHEPLVSEKLQRASDDTAMRVARGRQIASVYNCYGCHNIDGNKVHVHQYFGVYDDDGAYIDDALNWAPPRLLGQGAKTQPDWLYSFLQDVQPIRPWLQIRMPSFPMTPAEARGLVDYFLSYSQLLSRELKGHVERIDRYLSQIEKQISPLIDRQKRVAAQIADLQRGHDPSVGSAEEVLKTLGGEEAQIESQINELRHQHVMWFETEDNEIVRAIAAVRRFGTHSDLVRPEQLDSRHSDEDDRRQNWTTLLEQVRVLSLAYEMAHPYTHKHRPRLNETDPQKLQMQFLQGQGLFVKMGCMTGQCHRVGDEQLLAEHNMLMATTLAEEQDTEEEGYGEEDQEGPLAVAVRPDGPPGGAPNLWHTADRLQPNWVMRWLVHSATMQPGTRMQEYFTDSDSYFKLLAPDARLEMEKLYGRTGLAQLKMLVDFLYSVGPRRITLDPEGRPLEGGPTVLLTDQPQSPKPQE